MTTRPTWLVTGAHGFLGANLGAFLEGRAERIGAVRRPSEPDALFDRYVASDLADPVGDIEQGGAARRRGDVGGTVAKREWHARMLVRARHS